ncbi:copper resistance protein [Actinoplanes sp. SE50]|uniref:DUF305 domain-containing protein n=1 Tax=unclassified Actinoplanes TaxID=2626549 RepID=UPI00023EBC83|nr:MULTISPECIES: DUF305 domain-containing protein [unclassified Actinoplanes]AEV81235.1 uncharacterized protein ACPL_338 [Actinoplanes sp. SE50/110]ATO79638.1 copper resistance protein [Actinoplanes sp. SE50]SLL97041.1 DUF305 domain-containing protein [Actinoplanes sp. SE50/110]
MMRTFVLPSIGWRRGLLAGAAACAVLAVAGCGDTPTAGPGPTHAASPAAAGAASTAGFNQADVTFAQQMIPHHQSAIAMAKMATGHVGDARVAKLAGQIQAAQQPEITTMNRWPAQWGKPMPSAGADAMDDPDHGEMAGIDELDMTALMNAKGTPWDKQFLAVMVKHHQAAVTMAQQELAHGLNTDAKALAQKIIDDQQAQITEMKQIRASL